MSTETRVRCSWTPEVPGKSILETWQETRKGWLTRAAGVPLLVADDGESLPPDSIGTVSAGECLDCGEYGPTDVDGSIYLYAVMSDAQVDLCREAERAGYNLAIYSGLRGAPEGESSFGRDLRALAWLGRKEGATPAMLAALLGMQPRGVQAWLAQRESDGFEVVREQDKEDRRKVTVHVTRKSLRRMFNL